MCVNGDDELARLLPEPPPPRPARRDATIALAMRRFDGDASPAPAAAAEPARPGWRMAWGPTGALASILLVALIGVPIALRNPGGDLARPVPEHAAPAPKPPTDNLPKAAEAAQPSDRPAGTSPSPSPARPEANASGPPGVAGAPVVAGAAEPAREVAAAPPPPPPPPPPPAPASKAVDRVIAEDIGELVVSGRRAPPPQAMASASAITAVTEEALPADNSIVVTGTRVSRARTGSGRGDWNACTVEDPGRALGGCSRAIDADGKGARGAAGVQLAEGLQRGWQRDWPGAIAAFDAAIALQPRLALAWLNRGLAHHQAGDLEAAEADLDRAIRYAPRAARGYYHRSLVRAARGNARGARADAAQALRLDPAYEGVIED